MAKASITIVYRTDHETTNELKKVIAFNGAPEIARQEAHDIVKSWFERGYVDEMTGQKTNYSKRRYIPAAAILAIEMKMED